MHRLIEETVRVGYEGCYLLIVPDHAAGMRDRFTVYLVPSSPSRPVIVVGQELDNKLARQVARRAGKEYQQRSKALAGAWLEYAVRKKERLYRVVLGDGRDTGWWSTLESLAEELTAKTLVKIEHSDLMLPCKRVPAKGVFLPEPKREGTAEKIRETWEMVRLHQIKRRAEEKSRVASQGKGRPEGRRPTGIGRWRRA